MTNFVRSGKNRGGYYGERVDAGALIAEIVALAEASGWAREDIGDTGLGLFALRRRMAQPKRAVYISAGIHGDEPAGPLAVRRLLQENRWPAHADLWLCPCLNRRGFAAGTRENPEGVDLNRDYREPKSAEVRAHVAWLERQPRFDFALLLHEDWEAHGFYVYARSEGRSGSLASVIVDAVKEICPVDSSQQIDGWPAKGGVIVANDDPKSRLRWAEAIYLTQRHCEQAYTLEAPSDFSMTTRVEALVIGVRAALG